MKKTRVSLEKFCEEFQKAKGKNLATRKEINDFSRESNLCVPMIIWKTRKSETERGRWTMGEKIEQEASNVSSSEKQTQSVAEQKSTELLVIRSGNYDNTPFIDKHFIKWGKYSDIESVVKSKRFFPTFVTGLSGNGKTTTIEQACANLGREFIRVNFTSETNEGDLIGDLRLIDGDTKFQYGPVAEAYMRGAVLILDEIDLADTNRVMILQAVLEGKPLFIKKLGQTIVPEKGFTVFATANTKGKGSIDGRFAGTQMLNEAFLDRFSITIEQKYPTKAIETKIIANYAASFSDGELTAEDKTMIDNAVTWAQITRKTFDDELIDELISTRRLIAFIETYFVFGRDVNKALLYTTNRFDDEVKESFVELFSQIAAGVKTLDEDA